MARPGYNRFYETPELVEFVKATQIRVTMKDHQFVTHNRHHYFGVFEHIVSGRCNCHGHGSSCNTPAVPYVCLCKNTTNTEGNKVKSAIQNYNFLY